MSTTKENLLDEIETTTISSKYDTTVYYDNDNSSITDNDDFEEFLSVTGTDYLNNYFNNTFDDYESTTIVNEAQFDVTSTNIDVTEIDTTLSQQNMVSSIIYVS